MKSKAFFLWLLLLFVVFITAGCLKEQAAGTKTKEEGKTPSASIIDHLPIPMEGEEFNQVYGWINERTILYSTNGVQGENLYAYNLDKGTNRHITTSTAAIVSIDISDSGEYFFIRSSPASSSPSSSLITVMKQDGSTEFTHMLDAYDLTMEWNPYNEQQLFLAVFSEDWQDDTYFLSLADKKITEASSMNPFSKWFAKDQLVYLDWIGDNPSLSADLIVKNLNSGEEKKLQSGVSHLDTFKHVLMTVSDAPDDNEEAVYQFYGKDMKKLGSLTVPQVTSFSSRLVPHYDYLADEQVFYFFQPVMGKKEDREPKFQLMKFDLMKNKMSKVMNDLENEPLSCSKDGSYCLYGFQFEKLIDLKEKKIIQLTS